MVRLLFYLAFNLVIFPSKFQNEQPFNPSLQQLLTPCGACHQGVQSPPLVGHETWSSGKYGGAYQVTLCRVCQLAAAILSTKRQQDSLQKDIGPTLSLPVRMSSEV